MTARHAGSLVTTSSMLGVVGMADNAPYTAAKLRHPWADPVPPRSIWRRTGCG